jgi:exopolysaccharide biosynthesis polyprenyl glycosylphosphotransferase
MRRRKPQEQFIAVSRASFLAWVLFISFLYFFMNGYHYSRITLAVFLVINIFVLFVFKLIIMHILRKLRKKGYNLKYVLIVGAGEQAKAVAEKLFQHLEFGYSIVGFLARSEKEVGRKIFKRAGVIGTYEDLAELTKKSALDQVIFCLGSQEERLIRPLLSRIDNEGVDIKVILELGDVFTLRNKAEELDGLMILSLRESPLSGWQGLAKRILDVVGSFFGIIVLSPILAAIAVCIKTTSKGPVLYKQKGVGMDGNEFILYKFRSMMNDAERKSGAVFAKKSDPRVTKIGKILRRSSLDELPQLINVFRGDLSLVGPRPERPEFVREFYASIPRYMLRHKIRMGMTGWAQINGLRGSSCIKTRLKYDLYYIEHWSFWFDLKILFLTFFSVIKGEGAY